ncbi:MAG: ABC transporter ATP-binding protein [Dysgonamonadaceae bacterium]|nr:ABC transporter ATP-binding protein [Dysgonamonadaceae bacterium]
MIKINNVSKYYGDSIALESVNLEISDCSVVGLLGENGAGKTTLLKALAGLCSLNKGDITYDDIHNINESSEKIAFITEEGSFFPWMSAKQNADFFSDFYLKFDHKRFEKLCDFLHLPMNKKARTLSKGQKAKLEIALGFSKGAKYLLLDEPFLGNDIFTRRDFLKLMCDSLVKDETIIIATHLIDEIEHFIDRAIFIQRGRIKEDVLMDELNENGQTIESKMKEIYGYNEDRFKRFFQE